MRPPIPKAGLLGEKVGEEIALLKLGDEGEISGDIMLFTRPPGLLGEKAGDIGLVGE